MGDKVDDAVDKINKHYEPSTWDGAGFQDGQAKDSLDALAGLNSTEFKQAFDKLEPAEREMLARDAGDDLKKDDKYKEIINALASGDPAHVVDAKKKKEDEANKPEFEKGYGWELPDEKEHLHRVDLYQPKGASAALISLIEDTEFTMQWGFDTLGARDPKAAPDFTNVLDGEQVTTADGWSQIKSQHETLKTQLDKRQQEYTEAHKDVKVNTSDSAILNSETFKKLKVIEDDLNEKLQFEFPGYTQDGDKISYSYKDVDNSQTKIVAYEKNKDSGNYYLTAEAEQNYYVKYIDDAAEKWDEEYANATKEFQKKADKVDSDNNNNNNNKTATDNSGNVDNGANNGTANTGQNGSTQQAGYQSTDFGPLYDDLTASSTDSSLGSTSDSSLLGSGSGSGGASSSVDFGSLVQAALQNGSGNGSGTGTTATTGNATTPATSGSGIGDAMQQMMMMNAMSQMGNQNRQPSDDSGNDSRYSRDSRDARRRDQQGAAPAATDPAVQTSPPGVAAPTDAGTPPAVTAPGAMVDYPLPDKSTVQVSSTVAEALQRQQQNVAMDAAAAYAGTTGESTPNHPWSTINDVAQLKTGDVVQWENHSALVVNNQNGLQILDNGQLVPLDPNSPPLIEKYGNFSGYFHPTGMDVGGNAGPGAAVPPPPTVSQAQPSGPPPVTPPKV
ncbi:hypothetical protein OHB12_34220 [Nocardia sp. NBC_01730]|uniref:hypothetical protein n=1 Tax=Nocardia sp. NBC_01730 TaxID=2975998 RepID=UPI002E0FFB07|nr:hypothetical protein OHB12_34220 [Nocardia sp. NBC_01730]